MARSMVAEMHSGYLALRRECPMNIRRRVENAKISAEAKEDIVRILTLWAEARARFGRGGPFLFGTFCAADVIYAPTDNNVMSAFEGIVVVTRDAEAVAIAQRYGARILSEPENRGQTSAVSLAAETLRGEGAAGMLAVPGDIPMITPAEILTVLAAHEAAPSVTIVPAWDERGSNCMVCSPPGVIPFSFGNDSFQPHQTAARAAGIQPRIVPLPGIGLDIDNPVELRMLLERPAATRAHAWLAESGVAQRLRRETDDGRLRRETSDGRLRRDTSDGRLRRQAELAKG